MGMEAILHCAMDHADETFARQIQYILEQLLSEEVDDEDAEDEDDEDVDVEVGDRALICSRSFIVSFLFKVRSRRNAQDGCQICSQDDDDLEDEDDEDAEDDVIDEEEEIDPEDQIVTLAAVEENGEELLCRHYLAGMGTAIEEEAQTEAVLAQGQRRQDMRPSSRQQQQVAHGAPPQRPITPGNNRAVGGPGSQIPGMPREDGSEQPIRVAGTVDSDPGAVDGSAPPEEIQEYQEAFSTRAKLARTPQDGQRRR